MGDFYDDLEWSRAQSKLPLWEEAYREFFPDFAGMTDVPGDGWAQRAGIDRRINTSNGRTHTSDEKSRRDYYASKHREYFTPNATIFPDIALEYEHQFDNGTKTPGWIEKPLAVDYLAYGILPLSRIYLLPMDRLQYAWYRYKDDWLREFKYRISPNNGYKTFFCPVPVPVVLYGICNGMIYKHSWKEEYSKYLKHTDSEIDKSPARLEAPEEWNGRTPRWKGKRKNENQSDLFEWRKADGDQEH